MAIFDLFSKRQKRLRGEVPDVYQYEDFPIEFRRQIIMITEEIIGNEIWDRYYGTRGSLDITTKIYEQINTILCKEYGLFELVKSSQTSSEAIFNYFLNCKNHEHCLDIIELLAISIYQVRDHYSYGSQALDAIEEINQRFKEHGIGYQFEPEANEIIRVDSQFIHSEVVKPVLKLLISNKLYQGANDEFLSAHDHYRHGKYKECITECTKSFESLMKAIHEKRKWSYDKEKDTAQKLVQSCFDNGLLPEYLLSQYQSLINLLKSGLPTTRNRTAAHGQGHEITEVPEHLASYALHLTATNLLFLAQCEEKL